MVWIHYLIHFNVKYKHPIIIGFTFQLEKSLTLGVAKRILENDVFGLSITDPINLTGSISRLSFCYYYFQ